ncbi:hypothetical protein SESBI_31107 [Sesbania bispinosa]|nr:hypothetical protein SESBI_31107 [Sesbania bispinosa]
MEEEALVECSHVNLSWTPSQRSHSIGEVNQFCRKAISKVYHAMYIDKVMELAFDNITPEDTDFSSIQGFAETGFIESRLSRSDVHLAVD